VHDVVVRKMNKNAFCALSVFFFIYKAYALRLCVERFKNTYFTIIIIYFHFNNHLNFPRIGGARGNEVGAVRKRKDCLLN